MRKFFVFLCSAVLIFGVVSLAGAVSLSDGKRYELPDGYWSIVSGGDGTQMTFSDKKKHPIYWGALNFSYERKVLGSSLAGPDEGVVSYGYGFSDGFMLLSGSAWGGDPYVWHADITATLTAKLEYDDGEVEGAAAYLDIAGIWTGGPKRGPDFRIIAQAIWSGSENNLDKIFIGGKLDNVNLILRNPPPPVPEPATLLLLGSGLMGMAAVGRKRYFKNRHIHF